MLVKLKPAWLERKETIEASQHVCTGPSVPCAAISLQCAWSTVTCAPQLLPIALLPSFKPPPPPPPAVSPRSLKQCNLPQVCCHRRPPPPPGITHHKKNNGAFLRSGRPARQQRANQNVGQEADDIVKHARGSAVKLPSARHRPSVSRADIQRDFNTRLQSTILSQSIKFLLGKCRCLTAEWVSESDTSFRESPGDDSSPVCCINSSPSPPPPPPLSI